MTILKSVFMRLALARQISCFKELQGLYPAARNPVGYDEMCCMGEPGQLIHVTFVVVQSQCCRACLYQQSNNIECVNIIPRKSLDIDLFYAFTYIHSQIYESIP